MVARTVIIWVSIGFAVVLIALSFVFLYMEMMIHSDTGMIVLPFWFLALIFLLIAAATYIAGKNRTN